jgi:uncharacterized membrane protein
VVLKKEVLAQGKLFLRHVLPAAILPVHSLWQEVIGFIFVVFSVIVGFAGFRTARTFSGDVGEAIKIGMAAAFALLLAGYGISSFLKARKISRS